MTGLLNRGWNTIVCAASGPSLTAEQCAIVTAAQARGECRIIVVNETWRLMPSADVLYAADGAYYALRLVELRANFSGDLWTQQQGHCKLNGNKREPWADAAPRLGINIVRSVAGAGIVPDAVCRGGNSGHQAIGLAALFGARRIVLIGYDLQRTGGATHWHGAHAKPLTNGNPASWIPHFDTLARDLAAAHVSVVNASAATALQCFPRASIADALAA